MPGSQMSSKTDIEAVCFSRSMQASPLLARLTPLAFVFEDPGERISDSRLVIHDQNVLHGGRLSPRARSGDDGQLRIKRAPTGWFSSTRMTVVVFHDAAHNGQARPRSAFLGRKVGQE